MDFLGGAGRGALIYPRCNDLSFGVKVVTCLRAYPRSHASTQDPNPSTSIARINSSTCRFSHSPSPTANARPASQRRSRKRRIVLGHQPSPGFRLQEIPDHLSANDSMAERVSPDQSPVGLTPAPSIIRTTVRSGAAVLCITPFGTVNPCFGSSTTFRPSNSITKRPSTT